MRKTVLVGLIVGLLVSCSGGNTGASASVKGFMDNLKSGQFDKMTQYFEGGGGQTLADGFSKLAKEERELAGLMFSTKLSYRIGKTEVQGDNATVALNLTSTDLKAALVTYVFEAIPLVVSTADKTPTEQQAMMMNLFKKVLNDSSSKLISSDASVKLKKISGRWKIAQAGNEGLSEAFADVLAYLSLMSRQRDGLF